MSNLLARAAGLLDGVTSVAAILAAAGLAAIVGSYVYEVVTRYVFGSPTAWASDFVSYALCATVFLALPRVTRDKGHVAVTILVDIVPARIADVAHVAVSLLGFVCLMFAAWISLQENIRQFTKGIETLAILPIPQWWVSSFITFGLAFSALHMMRDVSPRNRIRQPATAEPSD